MEPSFITISIDEKIKFKKADLENLKDSNNGEQFSDDYRICSTRNIKYYFSISPNGDNERHRGQTCIFLNIELGSATKIEADIDLNSANTSIKLNHVFEISKGWGDRLCTTKELFDPTRKFFIIDQMIVKVTGNLKIYLPTHKIAYPISAHWQIKEEDLDAIKTSTNDEKNSLSSKKFQISSDPDIKFYFQLFPNGHREENRGNACIFVQLEFATDVSKVEAFYNFSIKSANYSKDLEPLYEQWIGYGKEICSTADLFNPEKQYFVDREMNITITGTLMIKTEREPTILALEKGIVPKGYHRNRNFTFIVGDKTVRVHKHVLKAASPVFEGMFASAMKEVKEKKMNIIDFEYEVVHAAMKLLYSAAVPTSFTFEQMLSLLRFSDKYDIQLIKDSVADYLIERISSTNVIQLINFTITTVSATKLQSRCKEYLLKCLGRKQAVYGMESLDKDFAFQFLMGAFVRSF